MTKLRCKKELSKITELNTKVDKDDSVYSFEDYPETIPEYNLQKNNMRDKKYKKEQLKIQRKASESMLNIDNEADLTDGEEEDIKGAEYGKARMKHTKSLIDLKATSEFLSKGSESSLGASLKEQFIKSTKSSLKL